LKPAPFAYAKARTLAHAIELLGKHKGEARILAGGQSLMAALNMRLDAPKLLVDINGIRGFDRISRKKGEIEIGALTHQADAERSPVIAQYAPLIAKALPYVGHPATRNRGTIGGSIAFADPAAELPACLIALGGEVEIVGPKKKRKVKADAFFKDLYETALGRQDVLTAIRLPAATRNSRYGFDELSRRHGDYAMVGLAASARANGEGLSNVRLAFFGVGPTPVRARKAEALLAKNKLEEAVAALDNDLDPDDDIQATAAYKKHVAGVLLRRVAQQLWETDA
jgi:carbon-monoxide dehydrogenase medium subunit